MPPAEPGLRIEDVHDAFLFNRDELRRSIAVDAVREADEAFLTNSNWEIRPVASVDGIDVGGGPMTTLLHRLVDERVENRHQN